MKARTLLGLLALLPGVVAGAAPQESAIRFADVAARTGLTHRHEIGGSGLRYMVETMGSGLGVADLDVDGWLDVYFAQGAATPGAEPLLDPGDALFRGRPDGGFERARPVAAGTGWSMGIAIADYDDDGYPDVYVSSLDADRLYRNNGDGTWADVTTTAGIDNTAWGASAAWADVDGDGILDLYVTNYVDFSYENHKFCGNPRRNLRAYCHPDVYNAAADRLFRGRPDGTFEAIGVEAGIADTLDGKGLGVVFGDFDDDGDPDIYVANDSTRNFLYRNDGGGRFFEDGMLAGVAFSADGQAEAGMGTDWGDYDGDGRLDVFVTNLDLETNSLYRNIDGFSFEESTFASGLGEPSLLQVGFGTNWADFDNDSDLDLFVANGHIIDNIADFRDNITYAQRNQVFENRNAVFTDVGAMPGLDVATVSRGSVVADFDRDGRLDVAVSNNGGAAELLRNESSAGSAITVHLRGRGSARWPAGARITARLGDDRILVRELTAGSSYCSSGPARIHIGIGTATSADLTVRWPDGSLEELGPIAANAEVLVIQGRGTVARR
jgi:hypothetical protein